MSCEYRSGVISGFTKIYYRDGQTGKVNKQEDEDISGWAFYVGYCKGDKKHGQGAMLIKNEGEVCIGEWVDNQFSKGVISELKSDNTRRQIEL